MIVVAISGKMEHGKDTFGSILHHEFGFVEPVHFGGPLKSITANLFDLTYEQCHDIVLKKTVDPRWGKTPGRLFQEVGDGARGIHPDVWVHHLRKKLLSLKAIEKDPRSSSMRVAVCDVRRPNELALLRDEFNAVCVRVYRTRAWNDSAPFIPEGRDPKHESETALDVPSNLGITPEGYYWPNFIYNDGTLQEYKDKVRTMISGWCL